MEARTARFDIELDRSSPMPLYHQVARELERAIADGRLARGDYLENEIALAEQWQVARLTLRRSIQELVDKGLLVRHRGVGTRVVNDELPRLPRLGSLYDEIVEQGRTPRTSVLAHDRVVADDAVAERLALVPGSQVIYLERCRHVDGRRVAILRNWLTIEAAADITTSQLGEYGLYQLLRQRGIWPHSANRRIAARIANPIDAALLGVRVGAPVLTVDSTMQDKAGRRVEVSEQIHDGSDYVLELSVVES
jgi:DNA-binding GntR family transcriptional regulator